jgi:hypothetical protein
MHPQRRSAPPRTPPCLHGDLRYFLVRRVRSFDPFVSERARFSRGGGSRRHSGDRHDVPFDAL